jgi:hypothetical protein
MKLYAKTALLTKATATGYQTELCNGYQRGENEDEVRGSYYKYLKDKNPGYDIKDIILLEIPIDLMKEMVEFDRFTSELFPEKPSRAANGILKGLEQAVDMEKESQLRPTIQAYDCTECKDLRCTCPGEPSNG